MNQEERLVEIETKISFQELLLEKLNDVLVQQQATIDRLDTTLKELVKRIQNTPNEPEIGPANEKPPHY